MPEKSPSPAFLTLDETGRALGLSAFTVRRYVSEGQLPACRIGGRVRVSEAAVAAFCESRPAVPGALIAPRPV